MDLDAISFLQGFKSSIDAQWALRQRHDWVQQLRREFIKCGPEEAQERRADETGQLV